MNRRAQPPRNRYLSGAHASERVLAKLVFVWLQGMTYSEMPGALADTSNEAEERIAKISKSLGPENEFRENTKSAVSRQSCHNLIGQVADRTNLLTYADRVRQLEVLSALDDTSESRSSRLVEEFLRKTASDFEEQFLAPARRETITEFMRKWATIVDMISANTIPYSDIRKTDEMKPFDIIQEPVILAKLQERYRRFRGYKDQAIWNHVAHYFALRFGLDFMKRSNTKMTKFEYASATTAEHETYWLELVTNATVVVLMMLRSDFGYTQIRKQFD